MRARTIVVVAAAALIATGCSMLPLVRAMLGTRRPNRMIPGQLFANGGGAEARTGSDGVARVNVERRARETVLHPAVILMRHPGELEITFTNDDPQAHLLLVAQSDGGEQVLDLPPMEGGKAHLHYGTPGLYLLADAVGNQMGQGTMGFVMVQGETPAGGRLDRPPQRRP